MISKFFLRCRRENLRYRIQYRTRYRLLYAPEKHISNLSLFVCTYLTCHFSDEGQSLPIPGNSDSNHAVDWQMDDDKTRSLIPCWLGLEVGTQNLVCMVCCTECGLGTNLGGS